MAGLAQTYVKMGRDAEAQQLLQKVVDANPKDASSLQLAGELMLRSDPNRALDLLKRADALQPSAHNDLLISHAYVQLNQPEESFAFTGTSRAKSRTCPRSEVMRAFCHGQYHEQGNFDAAIAALQSIPTKKYRCQSGTGLHVSTGRAAGGRWLKKLVCLRGWQKSKQKGATAQALDLSATLHRRQWAWDRPRLLMPFLMMRGKLTAITIACIRCKARLMNPRIALRRRVRN